MKKYVNTKVKIPVVLTNNLELMLNGSVAASSAGPKSKISIDITARPTAATRFNIMEPYSEIKSDMYSLLGLTLESSTSRRSRSRRFSARFLLVVAHHPAQLSPDKLQAIATSTANRKEMTATHAANNPIVSIWR